MSSEKTAAATGKVGELRSDPFAMLPFCGYNMGDYFAHWLRIGEKEGANLPKIFYVNWFRKSDMGRFLWPGYSENCRVLKWIFERVEGNAEPVKTPIGYVPKIESIEDSNLHVSRDDIEELLSVNHDLWKAEIPVIKEHFNKFGEKLPETLWEELKSLENRLSQ
jgi:phosphoenolpyruvate carboxykinase (GTP)